MEEPEEALPYISLARGLKETGYQVSIAGPDILSSKVRSEDFEFRPIRYGYEDFLSRSIEGKKGIRRIAGYMRGIRSVGATMIRHTLDDSKEAVVDARCILYTDRTLAGVHLAQRYGIPAFRTVYNLPGVPTGDFPDPSIVHPDRDMGERLNLFSYRLNSLRNFGFVETLNRWRMDSLSLEPISGSFDSSVLRSRPVPVLFGVSESLLPRPADWGAHIHMTGLWNHDSTEPGKEDEEERQLLHFINEGDRPVCIDISDSGEEFVGGLINSVKTLGFRTVILDSPDALKRWKPSGSTFPAGTHLRRWIYAHATAVIHDGNPKKFASSVLTGRPTLVISSSGEGYFWGRLLHRAGIGEVMDASRIKMNRVSEAAKRVFRDPDIRINAGTVRDHIRDENGVARASQIVRDTINSHYGNFS